MVTEIHGRVRVPKPLQKLKGKGTRPRAELLLRLSLQSNPEALCLVRATMQRATEVVHFPEAESRAIVRSVDEALANIIRHAYKSQRGLPIEVSCWRLPPDPLTNKPGGGLEILISDTAPAVDLAKLRGRPLEEIRPGGLGLHFMKQSMDVVEFRRKNGKNLLRMVKYLALSKPEEKPQGD